MTWKPFITGLVAATFMQAAMAQDTYNPEIQFVESLFQEAMQYREDGQIYKSIQLFETIIKQQPDLNRARLELAVAYHMSRRYEHAKEQLTQVLNNPDTPETVKLSITAYLAQLSSDIKSSKNRSTSSYYLSAGLFTDSNINLGPDDRSLTQLSSSAFEEDGSGAQLALSFAHRSRGRELLEVGDSLLDFEWLSQATLYNKAYGSGESDFNLGVISLNTGPALFSKKSWRAALNFKLDKVYFGNKPYAEYLGINPVFTLNATDNMEITVANTTTKRTHEKEADQGLDGSQTNWDINISQFYHRKQIGIQAGFKHHDNGASANKLHFTGGEVYIGGQLPVWKNARAYLTLSSRDYHYQAPDGIESTTLKRKETERLVIMGVSHDFRSGALKSWSVNAQYSYRDNESNIDAFSYDRGILELNLRRYFL